MDGLPIDYAGMSAAQLSLWIAIATGAGWFARVVVRGKKLLGLWGDMLVGLVGVYLVALLLYFLGVDLTERLQTWAPALGAYAVWIDVAVSALLGALVIRGVLRPFTGGA
jgi:uncharacterized membrane protein YeaQ/YmgE (transglycosylase-associated protein family)